MKLPPPPRILRVFLSNAKVVWKQWNVKSMLLTSFIIQLVLIFLTPFRKHTSNGIIISSIWLAYLLGDWVAIQAIGLISNPCGSVAASDADNELYAFWAQFLLLHLGGPDSITALALEDNELWLRTGLHLAVQIYGGLGILVKSVAHRQTSLWLPTLFMFTAGVIKYIERLSSLFYGRLLDFSTREIHNLKSAEMPGYRKDKADAELVTDVFWLFIPLKRLYTGEKTDTSTENSCTSYMYKCTPYEAFRVLEIQFNLAYEAFYTKMALICIKSRWKVLRLVVTLLQVGCLVIWLFFTDKDGMKEHNIRITYILLVGAIAVDVFAFLRIELWSDWTIAVRLSDTTNPLVVSFYNMILSTRKRTWGEYRRREDAPFWTRFRRALFRRWSESIPQLSLLSLSLDQHYNIVLDYLGLMKGIKQRKYVSKKWFSNHLRDFLFEDLKEKVKKVDGVQNIGKVNGTWAFDNRKYRYPTRTVVNICKLLDNLGEYDEILIQWHIITEICYHGDHFSHENDTSDDNLVKRLLNKLLSKGSESNNRRATNPTESGYKINLEEKGCNYREICKTLSDYMMYIFIHQTEMLSLPVVNWKLEETYETMKQFLMEQPAIVERKRARYNHACRLIRKQYREEAEAYFDSAVEHYVPIHDILNELEELENENIDKWEFMAKVWSDLLYYAAIQCKPNLHAANLKQGGELLSFVWLWLPHMGF